MKNITFQLDSSKRIITILEDGKTFAWSEYAECEKWTGWVFSQPSICDNERLQVRVGNKLANIARFIFQALDHNGNLVGR